MMYLRSLALILLLPCAMAVRGATVDEKEDTRADQPVAASFLRRSLMEDPPQGMRHLEGFGPVFDEIDEIDDTKARNIMKKRLKRVVANYNRNPTSKRTDQSISKFLAKLQKFFGKGKISEDQFNKISASFDNVFNPTTTTTTTTTPTTTSTTTTTTTTTTGCKSCNEPRLSTYSLADAYRPKTAGVCRNAAQAAFHSNDAPPGQFPDAESCAKGCYDVYWDKGGFLGVDFLGVSYNPSCRCLFSEGTAPPGESPFLGEDRGALGVRGCGPITQAVGGFGTGFECFVAKNCYHPTP